jgi:hypothetical protein
MTSPTTDKAHRLYNRLTQRYNVPGTKVAALTVVNDADTISLHALFTDGTNARHDLDPTRGVLDLSRQAQALINQHIEAK